MKSMGMLFVLIFWAIVFVVLSLILGLITLPFSYFLCKRQRKRKMVLSFLTPGVFIGIYAVSSFVCMLIIAIILGSDIGIGDSWSIPLKNGYELTSVDTPEYANINRRNDPLKENLIDEITHIQVVGDSVIGKGANGNYFIFNLKNGDKEDYLSYQNLTIKMKSRPITLVNNNTYYWEQRKIPYIIAGFLCLLITILAIKTLWRIGLIY